MRRAGLWTLWFGLDEAAAEAVLDRVFATLSLESASRIVVLPALREVGQRWERGEVTIAEEHFASNLIRARLLSLSRGWGGGGSSHAVLACPPGELHDLALIVFGLTLRGRGWRITYLGPDTPTGTVAEAAAKVHPDAVVISAPSRSAWQRRPRSSRSWRERIACCSRAPSRSPRSPRRSGPSRCRRARSRAPGSWWPLARFARNGTSARGPLGRLQQLVAEVGVGDRGQRLPR